MFFTDNTLFSTVTDPNAAANQIITNQIKIHALTIGK